MTAQLQHGHAVTLLYAGWWGQAIREIRLHGASDLDAATVLMWANRTEEALELLGRVPKEAHTTLQHVLLMLEAQRRDDFVTAGLHGRANMLTGHTHENVLGRLLWAHGLHRQHEDMVALTLIEDMRPLISTALERCLYHLIGWAALRQLGRVNEAEAHLALLGHDLEEQEHGPEIRSALDLALFRFADDVEPREVTAKIMEAYADGLHLPMLLHGGWIIEHLSRHEDVETVRKFLPQVTGYAQDSMTFRAHSGIALIQAGEIVQGEQVLIETLPELQAQKLSLRYRVRVYIALAHALQHPQNTKALQAIKELLMSTATDYPQDLLPADLRHITAQFSQEVHHLLVPRPLQMHLPRSLIRRVKLKVIGTETLYYGEQALDFGKFHSMIIRLLTLLKLERQGENRALRTAELIQEVFGKPLEQMSEMEAKHAKSNMSKAMFELRRRIDGELILSHKASGGTAYSLNEESVLVDLDILAVQSLIQQGQLSRAANTLQSGLFHENDVGPKLQQVKTHLFQSLLEACTDTERPLKKHDSTNLQLAIAPFTTMVWQDELSRLLQLALKQLRGR